MKIYSLSSLTLLLSTTLLLSLSPRSIASECKASSALLSAYYDFNHKTLSSSQDSTKVSNKVSNKIENTHKFELHRNNNSVIQRNNSQGVDDIWSLNGTRLSLNRAFEQYKHTIEYQSNELRFKPRWQDISQLVVTPELDEMQLVAEKKSGCLLEQHYTLKTQQSEYQLVWLPKLKLVKFFELKNASSTQQWALTDYQTNAEKITSLFNKYDSYQSTDYADVGDNESIPFLAAMINQGFSTAQNTQATHNHHGAH